MTFVQSVKTCLFEKHATFQGRASRSEFWWFFLFQAIVVAIWPDYEGRQVMDSFALGTFVTLIPTIVFFVPNLSVTVRRFHDRDISDWVAVALVTLTYLPVVLFFLPITEDTVVYILVAIMALALITSLVICIPKGTIGMNTFGSDPLDSDTQQIFG